MRGENMKSMGRSKKIYFADIGLDIQYSTTYQLYQYYYGLHRYRCLLEFHGSKCRQMIFNSICSEVNLLFGPFLIPAAKIIYIYEKSALTLSHHVAYLFMVHSLVLLKENRP